MKLIVVQIVQLFWKVNLLSEMYSKCDQANLKFGSYKFSVTPNLHEAGAELFSFLQNLFIVQSSGSKDKIHFIKIYSFLLKYMLIW